MRLQCIWFIICVQVTYGSNILCLLPISSQSHRNVFTPLVNALAERGHKVTIVSEVQRGKAVEGVTEIQLEGGSSLDSFQDYYVPNEDGTRSNMLAGLSDIQTKLLEACHIFYNNWFIQELLDGKHSFDLILLNMALCECGLGIPYKLQIPFIYVSPNTIFNTMNDNLRLPVSTSFSPYLLTSFTDEMTFLERVVNFLLTYSTTLLRHYSATSTIDEVIHKYLGPDVPSALDIEKNASFIILNSHPSVSYPRPQMPHVLEAGGMHCRPAKPLPSDLESWASSSGEHGFIYMSFGSIFPAHKIPEKFIKIFLKVFSKLPQKVLWKLKTDLHLTLPDNVRVSSWLPQQDVLGHPSIRAFITHGGLLSFQESTYHGVPIIGIPAAADQVYNVKSAEKAGVGRMLEWEKLSEETLTEALEDVLKDRRYKTNMMKRSAATKDRPQHPVKDAVFWTEYVIRHEGATHLRSGGLKLHLYQYYQLDVVLFLMVILLLVILLPYFCIKRMWKNLCTSSKKDERKKTKEGGKHQRSQKKGRVKKE